MVDLKILAPYIIILYACMYQVNSAQYHEDAQSVVLHKQLKRPPPAKKSLAVWSRYGRTWQRTSRKD